ncbi:MAG: relaxase/mobilization nuclease domain-containing protein [Ruminiclostridium sp.]|nr:relaxase/mobilization nuclease domain-containing protein [Ruminiclostridium sp.]
MAVTKIHPIETSLTKAIDYIIDDRKTSERKLCTGYCCSPTTSAYEFDLIKKDANKQGATQALKGYLAFHLIQSFEPGEVDYETAHKIGIELADKVLKGKYQYVVATHIDRGHVHNHIIFNSVSMTDHKKYNSSPSSYYNIRRTSDALCQEYGLSVIKEPKEQGKSYYETLVSKEERSWKDLLKQNIDRCIIKARDWDEFLSLMRSTGYEIKEGKHIAFRAQGQERFTRAKRFGSAYTEEQIRSRIRGAKLLDTGDNQHVSLLIDIEAAIKNQQQSTAGFEYWAKIQNLKTAANTVNFLTEHNLMNYADLAAAADGKKAVFSQTQITIKDTERRIKKLEEDIQNIDNYRKTKAVVDKISEVKDKEKYKREHTTEFIVYEAAKRYILKNFPSGKLPLLKELRAEQRKLKAEKDKLYDKYCDERTSLSEIQDVKKNVDMILGSEYGQQERKRKRSDELE